MKRVVPLIVYFLTAIVLMGSIGIWLPALIEYGTKGTVTYSNIIQNILTYTMPIIFAGCIDYVLNQVGEISQRNTSKLLYRIVYSFGLIILSTCLAIVGIILNITNPSLIPLLMWIAIAVLLISWTIWWLANKDKMKVTSPYDAMGGELDRELSNGNK